MKIERRIVNLDDAAPVHWKRLVSEWLADGFGNRVIEIQLAGCPVAFIVGVEFCELTLKIAERWHNREMPFTQEKLNAWAGEMLTGGDLKKLLG